MNQAERAKSPTQVPAPAGPDQQLIDSIHEVTGRRISDGTWFNPGFVFRIQSQERAFLRALATRGIKSLKGLKILDVGCGTGYWLRRFEEWGAEAHDLHGIDIWQERIVDAWRLCAPGTDLRCGNAARLDFPDQSFDMVSIFLVLSQNPNFSMRAKVGREICRVLKSGGFVLWYDYRRPPGRGKGMLAMTRRRIREVFPNLALDLRSASALPPLTRHLAPYTWSLSLWLENIRLLNTHYVGILGKSG